MLFRTEEHFGFVMMGWHQEIIGGDHVIHGGHHMIISGDHMINGGHPVIIGGDCVINDQYIFKIIIWWI